MKKTILSLIALLLVGSALYINADPYGKLLARASTKYPAVAASTAKTYYFKYWAQPTYYTASDTTQSFFLSDLNPMDTVISYTITTGGTKEYRAAILIQGGAEKNWRAPVVLDTLVRAGTLATQPAGGIKTTAGDSIVMGRSLWHVLKSKGLAGCDEFRFIVDKDTAACDQSGETYQIRINYHIAKQ